MFLGINFSEFFWTFRGNSFSQFGLIEDFAGINFRESALFKDFTGENLTFEEYFFHDHILWF